VPRSGPRWSAAIHSDDLPADRAVPAGMRAVPGGMRAVAGSAMPMAADRMAAPATVRAAVGQAAGQTAARPAGLAGPEVRPVARAGSGQAAVPTAAAPMDDLAIAPAAAAASPAAVALTERGPALPPVGGGGPWPDTDRLDTGRPDTVRGCPKRSFRVVARNSRCVPAPGIARPGISLPSLDTRLGPVWFDFPRVRNPQLRNRRLAAEG